MVHSASPYSRLKILLLVLEFPFWRRARHWSYSVQLGLEEGLRANGVEYTTVTTPWFAEIRAICANQKFDQVWLDMARPEFVTEALLDYLTTVAPVRLGRLGESLHYFPEEQAVWSSLKTRKAEVESQLPYVTHVLACDEKDAEEIQSRGLNRAIWWPQAVPDRYIFAETAQPSYNAAVFCGMRYGSRARFLDHPDLRNILVVPPSPEKGTLYPLLFNALNLPLFGPVPSLLPQKTHVMAAYLTCLRHLRQRSFEGMMRTFQMGRAVVNLPHFVKTYAGRVVEGMAAGRPVISWEIPDRPRNKALFEDEREILLFPKNDISALAEQIKRILHDPGLARRLTVNAQEKVRQFHTMQVRIRQILDWIATGDEPRR